MARGEKQPTPLIKRKRHVLSAWTLDSGLATDQTKPTNLAPMPTNGNLPSSPPQYAGPPPPHKKRKRTRVGKGTQARWLRGALTPTYSNVLILAPLHVTRASFGVSATDAYADSLSSSFLSSYSVIHLEISRYPTYDARRRMPTPLAPTCSQFKAQCKVQVKSSKFKAQALKAKLQPKANSKPRALPYGAERIIPLPIPLPLP
ncbi:hypothetical protein B0H16DRAFT_1480262 [Mycena metata]|uniref:Uncharacterized protein n=1 Tax=Mycena metata TaxID=1033252 RepID=A0AAD7H3N0_9AGAR|nr:hypothetical protein B0H16DRAFT_1480262 [Mycena metata]